MLTPMASDDETSFKPEIAGDASALPVLVLLAWLWSAASVPLGALSAGAGGTTITVSVTVSVLVTVTVSTVGTTVRLLWACVGPVTTPLIVRRRGEKRWMGARKNDELKTEKIDDFRKDARASTMAAEL